MCGHSPDLLIISISLTEISHSVLHDATTAIPIDFRAWWWEIHRILTRLRQRPRIRWGGLAEHWAVQTAGSSCWGRPRQGWLLAGLGQLLLARATLTRSSRLDYCFRSTDDGNQRPPSGTTNWVEVTRFYKWTAAICYPDGWLFVAAFSHKGSTGSSYFTFRTEKVHQLSGNTTWLNTATGNALEHRGRSLADLTIKE